MKRSKPSTDIILETLAKAENRKLRFEKLIEKTKLSRATVWMRLKELQEAKKVERIVDSTSEEYPPPVYYKSLEPDEDIQKRAIMAALVGERLGIVFDQAAFRNIISYIQAICQLLDFYELRGNLERIITVIYREADDYDDHMEITPPRDLKELKGLKFAIVGLAQRLFDLLVDYPHLLGIEADKDVQTKLKERDYLIEPKGPHSQLLRNVQDFADRVWNLKTSRELNLLHSLFWDKVARQLDLLFDRGYSIFISPEAFDKEITDSFCSSWVEEEPWPESQDKDLPTEFPGFKRIPFPWEKESAKPQDSQEKE